MSWTKGRAGCRSDATFPARCAKRSPAGVPSGAGAITMATRQFRRASYAGILSYQPSLAGHDHVALDDKDDVSAIAMIDAARDGAVWVSYIAGAGTADLDRALTARGYARLIHQYYPYPVVATAVIRTTIPHISSHGRPR